MSNVEYLPVWKDGATAEERFQELAHIAKKHPERFNRLVVLYQEQAPDGSTLLRKVSDRITLTECLGLLAEASFEYFNESRT